MPNLNAAAINSLYETYDTIKVSFQIQVGDAGALRVRCPAKMFIRSRVARYSKMAGKYGWGIIRYLVSAPGSKTILFARLASDLALRGWDHRCVD